MSFFKIFKWGYLVDRYIGLEFSRKIFGVVKMKMFKKYIKMDESFRGKKYEVEKKKKR